MEKPPSLHQPPCQLSPDVPTNHLQRPIPLNFTSPGGGGSSDSQGGTHHSWMMSGTGRWHRSQRCSSATGPLSARRSRAIAAMRCSPVSRSHAPRPPPSSPNHGLFFRKRSAEQIHVFAFCCFGFNGRKKTHTEALLFPLNTGQVPWGTRAPLPAASRCLAGQFECCHVIPNDSEGFGKFFHCCYYQKKNLKRKGKDVVKQDCSSPAPQNRCVLKPSQTSF